MEATSFSLVAPVRLYEAINQKATAYLHCHVPLRHYRECLLRLRRHAFRCYAIYI
jgi:hypothetical protein